jgi:hypothetical protein
VTPKRRGRHRRPSTTAKILKYAGGMTMAGIVAAGITAAPASAQGTSSSDNRNVTTTAHVTGIHITEWHRLHWDHLRHLEHLGHLEAARQARIALDTAVKHDNAPHYGYTPAGGDLSFAGLENLWVSAGGPSWAAWSAATIAECESGGRQYAENPSGASGYWQILGSVVPGNVFNPMTNAENAVMKFRDDGDTFAAWVCQA